MLPISDNQQPETIPETMPETLPETLAQWLTYLENLHDKTIDLGLTRIAKVADQLELTNLSAKVILIAGTNGKGTTSRFLEAYLVKQGYSVGLFNSPHLLHYGETVRINTATLIDSVHTKAFSHIEQHRGETSLTAFEFSTLAALKIFKDKAVDFVIMEVGLGGRGDATNIVNPDISVLTTVDLDHQDWLGHDRETIGYEKAGIFRANKPAVIGDFNIPQSVLDYGHQLNSQMVCANDAFSLTEHANSWCWQSGHLQLNNLILPKIPVQNVSTALAVLQQLGMPLDEHAVNAIVISLVVEGRFQIICNNPMLIADVAHNPQAGLYLATQLARYRSRKVTAVVGMLKDKDIYQTLANVSSEISKWILVDLAVARGAKAADLAQSLEKLGISEYSCYDCAEQGLEQAKKQQQNDEIIIIFGSFHTIAAAVKGC